MGSNLAEDRVSTNVVQTYVTDVLSLCEPFAVTEIEFGRCDGSNFQCLAVAFAIRLDKVYPCKDMTGRFPCQFPGNARNLRESLGAEMARTCQSANPKAPMPRQYRSVPFPVLPPSKYVKQDCVINRQKSRLERKPTAMTKLSGLRW